MDKVFVSTLLVFLAINIAAWSAEAFDDILSHQETVTKSHGPLPKDKILLKDVERLTFSRNKMTTSKRTHSIHQLACVGGTAGCKLFKPDTVECFKGKFYQEKGQYEWNCQADIDDRVHFNHVEVICEGYDYPEDDYILLGSCGLEFTLDYKNPQDHHPNSYYRHMDEHEKEMHRERTKAPETPHLGYWILLKQFVSSTSHITPLIGVFVLFLICSVTLWRSFSRAGEGPSSNAKKYKTRSSHLAATVLSTKKAC